MELMDMSRGCFSNRKMISYWYLVAISGFILCFEVFLSFLNDIDERYTWLMRLRKCECCRES